MMLLSAMNAYYIAMITEAALMLLSIITLVFLLRRKKNKSETKDPDKTAQTEKTVNAAPVININIPLITPREQLYPKDDLYVKDRLEDKTGISDEIAMRAEQAITESKRIGNIIDIDEDSVIINANKAESIKDAYDELSKEQKNYYDELKKYALSKSGTELSVAKSYENVKIGKRSILKLCVKRKTTVGVFQLENEMLKKYRKDSDTVVIRIKPSEVAVTDEASLQTAKDMVDLTLNQIIKEKAESAEERKANRRKRETDKSND